MKLLFYRFERRVGLLETDIRQVQKNENKISSLRNKYALTG